jgi:peptide chain release factor 1
MQFVPAIVAKLREKAVRFDEITTQISLPEVATDGRKLATLLQERGSLEEIAGICARFEALAKRRADDERMQSGTDAEMAALASEDLAEVEQAERAIDFEIKAALITEPADLRRKVIVEIRAGVGGDEATLFVGDLYKIYRRYVENRRWKIEDLEISHSEVGGLKEVVFAIEGEGAWRALRFESGGHRVQRVPETEAQGRIHTSAATVAVLAEADEVEINLRPDDLRIETMRAGGAGGQHVNKTESAVRITHIPTGLVAQCQDDRSQQRNRASAMRMLKARVLDLEEQKRHAERSAARKSQVGSGDRSMRVRTYNWPQNRVTDHRLNENLSLEQVLSGKLDPLLEKLDAAEREERIKNL